MKNNNNLKILWSLCVFKNTNHQLFNNCIDEVKKRVENESESPYKQCIRNVKKINSYKL